MLDVLLSTLMTKKVGITKYFLSSALFNSLTSPQLWRWFLSTPNPSPPWRLMTHQWMTHPSKFWWPITAPPLNCLKWAAVLTFHLQVLTGCCTQDLEKVSFVSCVFWRISLLMFSFNIRIIFPQLPITNVFNANHISPVWNKKAIVSQILAEFCVGRN